MFKSVITELQTFKNKQTLRIPLGSDNKGYLPRKCPNKQCFFNFKVFLEDWKTLRDDCKVYCPKCGLSAPTSNWHTTEQLEHAREESIRFVTGQIGNALRRSAHQFNQQQQNNRFIRISMAVTGMPDRPILIPTSAEKAIELNITCTKCQKRFAVIGTAYFCPCCGDECICYTFESSMQKNLSKLDHLDFIEAKLKEINKLHDAALTRQSLIESCVQDCVTAFQHLNEQLYQRSSGKKPTKNVFQRLTDGSALWKKEIGEGFEDWLSASKLSRLSLFFQRRHLLAHQEGIVDEDYINKTGDSEYQVGQRLVISPNMACEMTNLTMELGKALLEKAVR